MDVNIHLTQFTRNIGDDLDFLNIVSAAHQMEQRSAGRCAAVVRVPLSREHRVVHDGISNLIPNFHEESGTQLLPYGSDKLVEYTTEHYTGKSRSNVKRSNNQMQRRPGRSEFFRCVLKSVVPRAVWQVRIWNQAWKISS